MTSLPRSACVAVALLALPATAQAKPKPLQDATYSVVVRATYDEKWQYDEQSSIDCPPSACTTETTGSGAAHIALKSKPALWMVMRGPHGRPPMINVGTGEGAQATGPYLRQGELSTVHGGDWAAANPPEVRPATGCGNRAMTVDFNLAFTDNKTTLAPVATADLLRDDCPDGPSTDLEWDGGSAPSLMDVTTVASPTRFLSTRSFTVRGTRSWHASVTPISGAYTLRTGEKTATWSWEATFTMKKPARRHHR
jgi:hypothetical protein